MGPVLSRKGFVCVEQEKQRRAEPINCLTCLENQSWICTSKCSFAWPLCWVLPLKLCVQLSSKLSLGNKSFGSINRIDPIEVENLISVQFCILKEIINYLVTTKQIEEITFVHWCRFNACIRNKCFLNSTSQGPQCFERNIRCIVWPLHEQMWWSGDNRKRVD